MRAVRVVHRYRGPEPVEYRNGSPTRFIGLCSASCGWRSRPWNTREQAKAAWLVHQRGEAADLRYDIERDRDV